MQMSQTLEQTVCNPGGWGVSICWWGFTLSFSNSKGSITTTRVLLFVEDNLESHRNT